MTEAVAKVRPELPKKLGEALTAIEAKFPKEVVEIEKYLSAVRDKDITVLGKDEMFNITDGQGTIKAFKRTIILSEEDGTLVQPVPGGPFVVSAQGYEKVNETTGTIVMNADYVLVDGQKQQNPHVVRDQKNGRILGIYCRAIAFKYSPLGIPQVSDRTTVFDVPSYRLIDLLAKAKKFPQAFTLLPNDMEPEEDGTWAKYAFDENTDLYVNTTHDEALQFYSQIINREKKAIDFAQTFAQRNAAKHLHGIQKAPGNKWTLPLICWRPENGGPMRWDMSRYASTQKALTEMADGKTHGELPQIDLIKGTDFISDDLEALDAETQGEGEEGTGGQGSGAAVREDPENKIWAQLDTTREQVPEFYEKALKRLAITGKITSVATAERVMEECDRIADGGK